MNTLQGSMEDQEGQQLSCFDLCPTKTDNR